MENEISIRDSFGGKVSISVEKDNCEITLFLTKLEFLKVLKKMFDYRDEHIEEFMKIAGKD